MKRAYKIVTFFLLYSLLAAQGSGQSHEAMENEKFLGKWLLEKVELTETLLTGSRKTTKTTYTSRQLTADMDLLANNVLLNRSILEFEMTFGPNGRVQIETPQASFKSPGINIDALNYTFSFYDPMTEDQRQTYHYEFTAENQLRLNTVEVFYNDPKGMPLKGILSIYLQKE